MSNDEHPLNPANNGVRTRPDVWGLDEWDDTLLWYARAIAEMQTRPIADPTSWRFQAAIHAYNRNRAPYADPADQRRSAALLDQVPAQQLVLSALASYVPGFLRADRRGDG